MRTIRKAFICLLNNYKRLFLIFSIFTVGLFLTLTVCPLLERTNLIYISVPNENYPYTLCTIITNIALLSYTNLTLLLASASNKRFGIELKDFLKDARWRLRPAFIFGFSLLTIVLSVVCAIKEYNFSLVIILGMLILYILVYCVFVWALVLDTKFAADFLTAKFRYRINITSEEFDNRRRLLKSLFAHMGQSLDEDEKCEITIIKTLLGESEQNEALVKEFKVLLTEKLIDDLKADKIDITHNDHYENICNQVEIEEFSYNTLLCDVYSIILNSNKECINKYNQLRKISDVVLNSVEYKKIHESIEGDMPMGDGKLIQRLKGFLTNEFTENIGSQGLAVAFKIIVTKCRELEFDSQIIKEIIIDCYGHLEYASPDIVGKYEMGRHFPQFGHVFIQHEEKDDIFTEELGFDIMAKYIQIIIQNVSLITEKRGNSFTNLYVVELNEYTKWKSNRKYGDAYSKMIRFSFLFAEVLAITNSASAEDKEKIICSILNPIYQNRKKVNDIFNKVFIDFYIIVQYAVYIIRLMEKSEWEKIKHYKIGIEGKELIEIYENNVKCLNELAESEIIDIVLGKLGKKSISEGELQKIILDYPDRLI